jgi:hypothetical protein
VNVNVHVLLFLYSLPHLISRDSEDYMYSVDADWLPAFPVKAVQNITKFSRVMTTANKRDIKKACPPKLTYTSCTTVTRPSKQAHGTGLAYGERGYLIGGQNSPQPEPTLQRDALILGRYREY